MANIVDCSDDDLKAAKEALDRTMEVVRVDVDGRFNKAWHIAGDYSMLGWGTSDLRMPIDNFLSLNPISTLLFSFRENILINASSIEEHNEYFEMIFEESWSDQLQGFYFYFNNVLENITAAFSNEPRRIFGNQVWHKKFVKFLNLLETGIKPMSPAQLSHITSEWEGRGACDVAVTQTLEKAIENLELARKVDYDDIERKLEYLSLKHVNDIVLFYPDDPIITTNAAQSFILEKTQTAIRKEIDGYDQAQTLGEDKMEFIKYVNRDFYPNYRRIVGQYRNCIEREQKEKGENANLGPINDELNAQLDPLFKKLDKQLELAFPSEEA